MIRYGVISASPGGKLKTTLQIAVLIAYLVPRAATTRSTRCFDWVLPTLLVATVLVTLATGLDYVARAVKLRREGRAAA